MASAKRYSLDPEFFLDAMERVLAGERKPEIFHSDQGCQFSSGVFMASVQAEKLQIS